MTETLVRDDIHAFAAAVRAHLADLPADDVDDLLDGLEADLADQAAEAGDDFTLPDAGGYAAELRAAAGLPEAGTAAPPRPRVPLWRRARDRADRLVTALRAHAFGAWLIDTLVALRPVWWLLRGAVLFLLLVVFVGAPRPTGYDLVNRALAITTLPGILLFAALLVLSVQWGRGRWAPVRWLRGVRVGVSIVAIVTAPFLLAGTVDDARSLLISDRAAAATVSSTPGLALDGERVRNIFAYDADGQPVERVQLFDQNGRPLTTVGAVDAGMEWDPYFYGGGGPTTVSESIAGRTPVWNAFPLREVTEPWSDPTDALAPAFPFTQVPALPTTDTPEPSPTPTPAAPEALETAAPEVPTP